ncbi:hypothetical protein [Arthrobacter mobilis]|uniref:Activator of Hsp90 ATPase homolog 1-like protein n=1 Tax=Arthrobacter mobilis TaxID=2724944 RepID=A0A7X6HEI5_9MICC|nr:hypothetical protein [Arthrobacter mobilis]NKX54723.1 hypothetical protein [Arthrobacter mobilis]
MTKASNTAAIEKATGTGWENWVEFLDGVGGQDLPHKEIAKHAHERLLEAHPNAGWWAQSVTVAYEQHIGRRQPGQSCDGDFQVGVSKTFPGSMDEALEAWCTLVAGRGEFSGVPLEKEPATSSTEKWRYWRAALSDGSRVSLDIYQKAPGKAGMGINHTKLDSQEAVEHWRAYWRVLFKEL